jgi:hypothetical protein
MHHPLERTRVPTTSALQQHCVGGCRCLICYIRFKQGEAEGGLSGRRSGGHEEGTVLRPYNQHRATWPWAAQGKPGWRCCCTMNGRLTRGGGDAAAERGGRGSERLGAEMQLRVDMVELLVSLVARRVVQPQTARVRAAPTPSPSGGWAAAGNSRAHVP